MLSICSGPVSSANRLSAHSSSRTPKRKDMERLFNYLGIDKSFTPCRPEYTLIMNTINLLLKMGFVFFQITIKIAPKVNKKINFLMFY